MSESFMLHVSKTGTFEPSGDYSSKPEELKGFIESLQHKKVTIYLHGGLVDEESGMNTANKMAGVFDQADSATLSIIWETGLLETFSQNFSNIRKTKLFNKLLRLILKRVISKFASGGARGVGISATDREIDKELSFDLPFSGFDNDKIESVVAKGDTIGVDESVSQQFEDQLRAEFEEDIAVDFELQDLLQEQDNEQQKKKADTGEKGLFSGAKFAWRLAKIAYRVIKRKIKKRDHGLYPTVIEEILRELYLADLGAWVWQQMKNKAEAMWDSNDDREGEDLFAGSALLTLLAKKQQEIPDLKINLVGHSAGAIAICHLLQAAVDRHSDLRFDNVVFLAPAARSDLAFKSVAKNVAFFERFRMYTMSDKFEQSDQLVPKLYTRSLLYFISGVLEPSQVDMPLSGMMRFVENRAQFSRGYARKWSNYVGEAQRSVISNTAVLDRDAPVGARSEAEKHGAFDDDEATQKSLIHILS